MARLVHLSIHDHHPADVQPDWDGDREGAGRRHSRALLEADFVCNGLAARDREHDQHRRGSRGDGLLGADAAGATGHLLECSHYGVRYRPRGLRIVPYLLEDTQVPSTDPLLVRPGGSCRKAGLGDGFSRHADPSSRVLGGLSAQHRRDPGHDDLPISVLLAGITGGRGGNRERPDFRYGNRETPGDAAGSGRDGRGHGRRDVLLPGHHVLHHRHHGRHTARRRDHHNPDRVTGGRSPAAAGRRPRLPALRGRDHRHWSSRDSGTSRRIGVRSGRDCRTEGGARQEARPGPGVLRGDWRIYADRYVPRLVRHQPDNGPLLRGRVERPGRATADGVGHHDREQEGHHGPVRQLESQQRPGMGDRADHDPGRGSADRQPGDGTVTFPVFLSENGLGRKMRLPTPSMWIQLGSLIGRVRRISRFGL